MDDPLPILPFVRPVSAFVPLPGSKSITNRALILAALSRGVVRIRGALFSRDSGVMCEALRQLGFAVESDAAARSITVVGQAGQIPRDRARLHMGNAGTAARFLPALLALHPNGEYALDGDAAMRVRPMAGLLRCLESQGATATAPDGGRASTYPFTLRTRGVAGECLEVDASASSQIFSALLMVAPLAQNEAVLRLARETVSMPFVKMTLRMIADFGRGATEDARSANTYVFANRGPYFRESGEYLVEPDATAASYFMALPLAAPATVRLALPLPSDGGYLQGDMAFADVLGRLGVATRRTSSGETEFFYAESNSSSRPPVPSLGGNFDYDFGDISDTFLTLAALAPLLPAPLTIRNVGHARHQETDRVLAMATELERLGQRVEPCAATLRKNPELGTFTVFPDAAAMRARSKDAPIAIDTYEDHRIAMSFGVLGSHNLHGDGRAWLAIKDPGCCGKTFPDFFETLKNLRDA